MRASNDKSRRHLTALIALLLLAAACSSSSSRTDATRALPLRTVRDVRLPGRTTRFDYQSIDTNRWRLYLAHLGDSTVVVVDLDRLRPIATIGHIADVHGVLAVPELNRVFATATGSDQLVAIDATTNRVVGRSPTGSFPDGLAYDSVDGLVIVSNKDSGSVTLVDAHTLRTEATIKLGHEVGNVAYDPATHLAWAAVRTPEQLVAFDLTGRRVVTRISLPGCDGAHGVYIRPRGPAFVACERNARLAIVDPSRRRLVKLLRVGDDPDVLAIDPRDGRLYVAAESGTVTVVATQPTVRLLARATFAEGAHSVAVDAVKGHVFFPLADIGGRPVLRVVAPRVR